MKPIIILLLYFLSTVSNQYVKFPLYKPKIELNRNNLTELISNIEQSNLTANLSSPGNPINTIPFQIEMISKEISIDDSQIKKTTTMEINIQNNSYTFQMQISEYKESPPIFKEPTGILDLFLGPRGKYNNNHPEYPSFIPQLKEKNIVTNSVFYFTFPEIPLPLPQKKQIKTVSDFLKSNVTLTIGDYPYNIEPTKCSKTKSKKTANIQQVIKTQIPFLLEETTDAILYDPSKCIGCGNCVRMCGMAKDTPWQNATCIGCGQCTTVCPKNALREVDGIDIVSKELKSKRKILVVQIAPASRINMAEALGVPPGTISTGKLITALKMLGFDYVFDTTFGADMTIVEEATEFIRRLNDPEAVFPMFTSCCPAWINYVEKIDPSLIPNLSSCKSPCGMLSTVIKKIFSKKINVDPTNIFNVAVMPCTAKKDEIKRPQLDGNTDAVVTTRELAKMIQNARIDFENLEDTEADRMYSEHTGGGAIFCNTGGVMEAALRSSYKMITGKDMVPIELEPIRGADKSIKLATVDFNGRKINVAVVHGIENAIELIKKIKAKEEGFDNLHFIEVMSCPGGCVGGGGSPVIKGKTVLDKRIEASYTIDRNKTQRTSQDNQELNNLYSESFDSEYGSDKAKKLLHTYYTDRKVQKMWGMFFKEITFNHTSVSSYFSKGFLNIESNFIIAPNNFLPVLNREFFYLPDINKKCIFKTNDKFGFILCENDTEIIKNFPKLEFYSDELNHTFTLNGNDLFIYDSNYGCFILLIVFDLNKNTNDEWMLGLPFIKKDTIYFDIDNENIGVCVNDLGEEIQLGSIINKGLIGVIFILLFIILWVSRKLPNKNKQKKGIELIDFDVGNSIEN